MWVIGDQNDINNSKCYVYDTATCPTNITAKFNCYYHSMWGGQWSPTELTISADIYDYSKCKNTPGR